MCRFSRVLSPEPLREARLDISSLFPGVLCSSPASRSRGNSRSATWFLDTLCFPSTCALLVFLPFARFPPVAECQETLTVQEVDFLLFSGLPIFSLETAAPPTIWSVTNTRERQQVFVTFLFLLAGVLQEVRSIGLPFATAVSLYFQAESNRCDFKQTIQQFRRMNTRDTYQKVFYLEAFGNSLQ